MSLSLFYVLFLSMESLLDERAAAFLPPDAVAFAESVAATASLVGFLLYALVRMRVPGFASLIHASGTLSAVGLLTTSLVPGALALLASGLATMLFVGFAGAAAHEAGQGALPTARKSPAPLAVLMPRASWSSAC